jgi:hypothetical protein
MTEAWQRDFWNLNAVLFLLRIFDGLNQAECAGKKKKNID